MWPGNIIKEKYINKRNEPLSFKKGSHIWKNIGVGWETYKHSIAWVAGDGTNINLWNDKWLQGDSLRSLVLGPLNINEHNLCLSSLKHKDITSVCSINLPKVLVERVRATELSSKADLTYSTL